MKKLVISALFVMQVLFSFAQSLTGVTGKVVDSKTQKPLQNVVVTILNSPLTALTDGVEVLLLKKLLKEINYYKLKLRVTKTN